MQTLRQINPKFTDIVEALSKLKVNGKINTGKPVYTKLIEIHGIEDFFLSVHADIVDSKLQYTFLVTNDCRTRGEQEPKVYQVFYENIITFECHDIPNEYGDLKNVTKELSLDLYNNYGEYFIVKSKKRSSNAI